MRYNDHDEETAAAIAGAIFDKVDRNGDGVVDRSEFQRAGIPLEGALIGRAPVAKTGLYGDDSSAQLGTSLGSRHLY